MWRHGQTRLEMSGYIYVCKANPPLRRACTCSSLVCQMVGLDFGIQIPSEPGTGPIWMDELWCLGDEVRLDDCVFAGWGNHDCEHSEDVALACYYAEETGSPTAGSTTPVPPGQCEGGGGRLVVPPGQCEGAARINGTTG